MLLIIKLFEAKQSIIKLIANEKIEISIQKRNKIR